MLPFLMSGIVYGLAGGLAPGPTTTLVLTQTLRHGRREGLKVAIAPALTDAPIVLAAVLLMSRLPPVDPLLGGVSLLGALFLFYLAWESLRIRPVHLEERETRPRSVIKGVLANLLNPHPYLFWLTIGAPTLLAAARHSDLAAVAFVAALYICLIGAKMVLAVLVDRGRRALAGRGYLYTVRLLGLILLAFAVAFLRDGLRYLGWVSSN